VVERKEQIGYKRRMKTQKVLALIFGVFSLSSIFEMLFRRLHSVLFLCIFFGLQLLIWGLVLYALYRENNLNDKSEAVSKKSAIMIFSGITLMVVFIAIRALHN
jgi:uncharacterized membrane protein